MDIAPTLKGVDAVVTDPPYGFGAYATDDDRPVIECLKQWERKAVFGYPETLVKWCMGLGVPDEWVTWWPTNKFGGRSGKKLPRDSESVAIWGEIHERPLRPRSHDSWTMKMAEQQGRSEMATEGDVWRDPSPGTGSNSHLRKHPNEKPESVMMKLVRLCSIEGEIVLDPYMGSGTTGIACIRTGRRFVGIEKDPAHYATAMERIRREIEGDLFYSQHKTKLCRRPCEPHEDENTTDEPEQVGISGLF